MTKSLFSLIASAIFLTGSQATGDLFLQDDALSSILGQQSNQVSNPDEKLIFAFELVRHGARAPIEDRDLDKFSVTEGQLTPEGMRQRYLLGHYSRQRYTETFPLLSKEYNPEELYIQSTNVNRTMQSGYSELMGLYPPGQGAQLTQLQVQAISDPTGLAVPPFAIRDIEKISESLGADALPHRFDPVSILVYNNNDIRDDVSSNGCPLIEDTENSRIDDDAVFEDYQWMIEQTRESMKALYGITDEYIDSLNYHHYERLTDTAVALDYEGYPEHETYFSDDQWELTHEFQKIYLGKRETKDSTDLEISRILRKPIAAMKHKVAANLGQQDDSELKFMIYSAHDDQVTNMLNFLAVDYFWVPYASTVTFELKYSASCLESECSSEECFGVSILSNGKALQFPGCSGDHFSLEGCTFPEFLTLMQQKWYSGPKANDLDQACFTPIPDPPQD